MQTLITVLEFIGFLAVIFAGLFIIGWLKSLFGLDNHIYPKRNSNKNKNPK